VKKIKHTPSNNVNNLVQSALEYRQTGNLEQAERLYNNVLELRPRNADAYYGLGNIMQDRGKLDEAITSYKKTIQLKPNFVGAYYNLGSIFKEKGQFDEAIQCYQKCMRLDPTYAGTYNTLGAIFQNKKNFDEAIQYFQRALLLDPNFDQPYNNLGLVFQEKGQLDDAIEYYQKALQLNPNYAKAHYNLGNALQEKGQLDEAIACYQKVSELTPDFIEVYDRLGTALQKKGEGDRAIECYRRALSLNPDFVGPYISLGRALRDQGKYVEAEECFRQSLKIMPDCFACYSNLLFQMLYNSNYDAETIFSEHLKFAKHCAEPLISSIPTHTNERSADRKLKIGYVSLDFRYHSVAYFFEPILLAHDRDHFEIFCYSDVVSQDEVTERIKSQADQWRNLVGISNGQAVELIRKDGIDILMDLAGLTAPRILMFAHKPAPVQATWIGYPATTGLSTMDYKLVDNYTDPDGMTEQFYTEELIRMPEGFLCYLPERDSPEIGPLPAFASGRITFGSFNNFTKISPLVFALWSRMLKVIPDSHLVIKTWSFSDRTARQYALDMFVKEGVSPERIILLPYEPSTKGHLNIYNRIDIALDTFPYNGTTTTCEALWMGVPVITLSGNTHVSRVGMSLLSNVGLPELVAKTDDEYIAIAMNLANDLHKLKSLREGLRGMMQHSPLTDANRFAINLENCYRAMWEEWCKTA
jgi:predicted O-linked N-acetylglucosamine transferase (SPINDLY family)